MHFQIDMYQRKTVVFSTNKRETGILEFYGNTLPDTVKRLGVTVENSFPQRKIEDFSLFLFHALIIYVSGNSVMHPYFIKNYTR